MSTHLRLGVHRIDTTKELGEQMSFIGVVYNNMGEGILTGAEMIQ